MCCHEEAEQKGRQSRRLGSRSYKLCPTRLGHVPVPSASALLQQKEQPALPAPSPSGLWLVWWVSLYQNPAAGCRGDVTLSGLQLTEQGCAVRGSGTYKTLPAFKKCQWGCRQAPVAQQPDWLAPQQGASSPDSCSRP